MRNFMRVGSVDLRHFCHIHQVGAACVCLGVLPRSSAGGGARGGVEATKLALNAVIPVPSSKVCTSKQDYLCFDGLNYCGFTYDRFTILTSQYASIEKRGGDCKRCVWLSLLNPFPLIFWQIVGECKMFKVKRGDSHESLPLKVSNILAQPTCKVLLSLSRQKTSI